MVSATPRVHGAALCSRCANGILQLLDEGELRLLAHPKDVRRTLLVELQYERAVGLGGKGSAVDLLEHVAAVDRAGDGEWLGRHGNLAVRRRDLIGFGHFPHKEGVTLEQWTSQSMEAAAVAAAARGSATAASMHVRYVASLAGLIPTPRREYTLYQ